MKQYLLSVHYVEGAPAPTEAAMQKAYRDVDALNTELQKQGAWVFGGGLQEPSKATVVRMKDGELLQTDGPFPEAKEHLGGFSIIRAADLDEALLWARKATVACAAPVEVRPFQDEPA